MFFNTQLRQHTITLSPNDMNSHRAEAWERLITSRKLGYFDLLKNLRPILAAAPHLINEVVDMLTDERLISQSLVLPFRFLSAVESLEKAPPPGALRVIAALSDALDLSLVNVPDLGGRMLVALDGSASMRGRSVKTGSLFAAVLAKAHDADVMLFSNEAKPVSVHGRDGALPLARWLQSQCAFEGTNFRDIFKRANGGYDRVVILSDTQGWTGRHAPTDAFVQWRQRHGGNPKVFSVDLSRHAPLHSPERQVYCMGGAPDEALEVMQFLDSDNRAPLCAMERGMLA